MKIIKELEYNEKEKRISFTLYDKTWCCKQLQEIIKNIIFFLIFSAEYDIIFLKIRKIAMNHLD